MIAYSEVYETGGIKTFRKTFGYCKLFWVRQKHLTRLQGGKRMKFFLLLQKQNLKTAIKYIQIQSKINMASSEILSMDL